MSPASVPPITVSPEGVKVAVMAVGPATVAVMTGSVAGPVTPVHSANRKPGAGSAVSTNGMLGKRRSDPGSTATPLTRIRPASGVRTASDNSTAASGSPSWERISS